jgi:hypothetical protein
MDPLRGWPWTALLPSSERVRTCQSLSQSRANSQVLVYNSSIWGRTRARAFACGNRRQRVRQAGPVSMPLFRARDAACARPRNHSTRGAAWLDPRAKVSRWPVRFLPGSSTEISSSLPGLEPRWLHVGEIETIRYPHPVTRLGEDATVDGRRTQCQDHVT